jgi:hypothetical protein
MPIRRYIEDSAVFEPEAVEAMSRALDEACLVLEIGPDEAAAREIIAVRIVELARAGLMDAGALRNRVLSEAKIAA